MLHVPDHQYGVLDGDRPGLDEEIKEELKSNSDGEEVEPSDSEDSEDFVEVPPHFICPYTLCLLEDPVNVPCCGRTFSRVKNRIKLQSLIICSQRTL